jgi:hypothetical protein
MYLPKAPRWSIRLGLPGTDYNGQSISQQFFVLDNVHEIVGGENHRTATVGGQQGSVS